MILLLLSLVHSALHPSAFAEGGTSSHGGDAVVCYNQEVDRQGKPVHLGTPLQITSVELLDYWEWRQSSPRKTSLGEANLQISEKIKIVIDRIAKLDPVLATELNKIYQTYQPSFVDRAKIPDISDFTPRLERSSNCVIEQLAVQYRAVVFGQAWLQIDAKLYQRLTRDEQAGLVLHEILYRFALSQAHPPTDSNGLRYLNFVFSTDTQDVTPAIYSQILSDAKLAFDYFPLYQFFKVTLPGAFQRLGIDSMNYQIPNSEDWLSRLTETGLVGLEVTHAHELHLPQDFREASLWKVSEGDIVYFNLRSGDPFGLKTKSKSEIRSGPHNASLVFLGNATCIFTSIYTAAQPDFTGMQETLTCDPGNLPTALLQIDGQEPISVSEYYGFLYLRASTSYGGTRVLTKTFSGWGGQPVAESIEVSGTVKTRFAYGEPNCQNKTCKYQVVIDCLSTSPIACSVNRGQTILHPGESTTLVWNIHHR